MRFTLQIASILIFTCFINVFPDTVSCCEMRPSWSFQNVCIRLLFESPGEEHKCHHNAVSLISPWARLDSYPTHRWQRHQPGVLTVSTVSTSDHVRWPKWSMNVGSITLAVRHRRLLSSIIFFFYRVTSLPRLSATWFDHCIGYDESTHHWIEGKLSSGPIRNAVEGANIQVSNDLGFWSNLTPSMTDQHRNELWGFFLATLMRTRWDK